MAISAVQTKAMEDYRQCRIRKMVDCSGGGWRGRTPEGLQPAAIDNSDMHDPRSQMQDADNRLRPDMSQRRRLPLTPAATCVWANGGYARRRFRPLVTWNRQYGHSSVIARVVGCRPQMSEAFPHHAIPPQAAHMQNGLTSDKASRTSAEHTTVNLSSPLARVKLRVW